ncbi:N-acetylglucosamine-6-phosphate deacetylase [Mesobacterium sp. TK19101]|uniref:N-acetylglucosamine-6-phosphate deacetylase n=1 Tax=Mesobacterium hydrothermale TaxID=3111907 RepID=A0ABU6HKL1_9RHOB|nr:N-acetylglucosamine-6-phosphate deacetylase [Mesobacterium sp. TK19101]MEC3862390.1 N-acetylglucosamine-6-phosphate deacetylase [Mesobacterium sp. TK19101]
MSRRAFLADRIFDGTLLHDVAAVLTDGGRVLAIVPQSDVPADVQKTALGAGIVTPGFVDLQVNGGGGRLFNNAPDVQTLRMMARAHGRSGATSIVPTLITDAPEVVEAAVDAAVEACQNVEGVAGLHLEGPHLDARRKGAHDAALIRPMTDADLRFYRAAAARLPMLKITLAPAAASASQIAALAEAEVLVSLGHAEARYEDVAAAAQAGARCVTHLFNAMSQVEGRHPGVAGAALTLTGLSAGIIADGIHVHPANLALAAGVMGDRLFLVSDAMAVAGSDATEFTLNGRRILRGQGRLTLEDGTLAGADLDLPTAVAVMVGQAGVPLAQALAMATRIPADLIGRGDLGRLTPGSRADFALLSSDLAVRQVWRGATLI